MYGQDKQESRVLFLNAKHRNLHVAPSVRSMPNFSTITADILGVALTGDVTATGSPLVLSPFWVVRVQ